MRVVTLHISLPNKLVFSFSNELWICSDTTVPLNKLLAGGSSTGFGFGIGTENCETISVGC